MAQYRIELRRILKSVMFILTVLGILLFAYTQGVFPPDLNIKKPEPDGFYGMKPSNDPSLIMPEAAESLYAQFIENKYITYPNGFYKTVRLNREERKKMAEILSEMSVNEISDVSQGNGDNTDEDGNKVQIRGNLQVNEGLSYRIVMPDRDEHGDLAGFRFNRDITWDRFKELMVQADKLLGGGSDFSETWIGHRFGKIPVTYDEALADHELILYRDRVTGSFARLFCDYMGIIMGLLPVFPAVYLCICDRKNISSMLYTRKISSVRFILTRFLALVTATLIPILLMSVVLTIIHAKYYGINNIDVLAYFKYSIFWILPTATAAVSVGMFFTTLTGTPVAIAIQLIWWFCDMLGGNEMYTFFGVRPFQLIPRHNGLGNVDAYLNYLPDLIKNRIRILLIAVLMVIGTVYVFSAKRRGLFYVSVFKRRKI